MMMMKRWWNGWIVPDKNGKAETTEANIRGLKKSMNAT